MYKALMCFGGADVRKVAQNISTTEGCVLDNPYRAAMEALDDYYSPRMTLRYERFKFRQIQFLPNEKLDQFVIRLRSQAVLCGFGEQMEPMIMDQIVYATNGDDKLRAKYLEADTSLDELLKIGRTYESVKSQILELREVHVASQPEELNLVSKKKQQTPCKRCFGDHLQTDRQCPARNSRCNLCRKLGHYARCCRGARREHNQFERRDRTGRDNRKPFDRKQKFVREIDDVTNNVEVRELFHLSGKRSVEGSVGGVNIKFVVDTGADEDVLSEEDWKTLKRIGFIAFDVRKGSDKVFQAYGSRKSLTVLGEVDAEIKIGDSSHNTTFFVIRGGKCSLLCGNSAEKLGVVKFLHALSTEELPCIKGKKLSL